MFLNNLKIRTKIFLAFLSVIAVSVAAIGVNLFLLNNLNQKHDHINTVVDPGEIASFDLQNSFNVDIRAIEGYGNGFSDLDETEKIVHAAEAKIDSDISILERSDVVQPKLILALRDILKKDEMQDEKVFELKKDGKDVHQDLVLFNQVNSEVSTIIDEIINASIQHKTEHVQEFENAINQSGLYIGVSLVGAILISLLLALVISFMLSKQIKLLRDMAIRMSQGDFAQRVSIVSRDEIGDLASAFNDMAAKVMERTVEIEKSKKQLEVVNLEIQKKLEELDAMNKLMVGRELKMVEMKKELEELKGKIGQGGKPS